MEKTVRFAGLTAGSAYIRDPSDSSERDTPQTCSRQNVDRKQYGTAEQKRAATSFRVVHLDNNHNNNNTSVIWYYI